MIMGVLQAELLPQLLGFNHPATWIITLLAGLALGAAIGALHGMIIAFLNVPSFIVTLGGLLVWRGATWFVTSGRTVAPMDATFRLDGRRHGRLDRRYGKLDRRPDRLPRHCRQHPETPASSASASAFRAARSGPNTCSPRSAACSFSVP